MSEERFRELWAKVEHIGKIEHLSDDALLALGGIFGELKSKINKQAERVEELEKQAPGIELELINGELADALEQNKRYRKALEEIMKIDENHKWNLYGLAYSIAEKTLSKLEVEE